MTTPSTHNKRRFLNMDLLRYFLSLAVIVAHFNILFGTDYYWPMSSSTAVGAFFGLSGFLVYASYRKHPDLMPYIKSRAKRILPSYWFIIIVSVLGLAFVSSLSTAEYFSNSGTWKYLAANLCFMNFVCPDLPGVFAESPVTAVNGSLWTLKVEWMLYLSIPLFFYFINRWKWGVVKSITLIIITSVAYQQAMEMVYEATGKEIFNILSYQFLGQLVYFYMGVLLFHMLPWVEQNKWKTLALGTVVMLWGMQIIDSGTTDIVAQSIEKLIFPIGIVTVCLILSIARPICPWISRIGNCSYEMYLFHFPVLQLARHLDITSLMPSWVALLLCTGVVFGVSYVVNLFNTKVIMNHRPTLSLKQNEQ